MINLSKQLKDDFIDLFSDDEEYPNMIVKEEYEILPKIGYPCVIIEELNNENDDRYFDDSGECVSYLSFQIEIRAEQSATRTARENVRNIGDIIDNFMKGEKYWCMPRVGGFSIIPMSSDNNVMIGYLRYECNVDIKTNTIYRRF